MRHCEIAGTGTWLPDATVTFGTHTRYRIAPDESHLDALATAARRALAAAGITAEDVDCLIGASAAGVQPIPCTAALVLEQLTTGGHAAAFDVNSTCTSFITALDVASRYLEAGDYETVLIVSGDVGTRFLNPDQPESFSLFSDAAAAVVLRRTDRHAGVLASAQRTWPEHAHDTELRGGLSAHPASTYATGDPADYLFDMDGRARPVGHDAQAPRLLRRLLRPAQG
jgi:3-oxoacyl-[acyl-carrier-protein] synthase-3